MRKDFINFGFYFIAWLLILTGLYLSSLYNYLLFHSLVEIFSIVIACSIFFFTWNSRKLLTNNYLFFIGIAYLFVGGFDLLHTLSYKGMTIFSGYDTNLPTQLWIVSRYFQSLCFIAAPFFITREIRYSIVLNVMCVVVLSALFSIFYWENFPVCYLEGYGLTSFKKNSEYIISAILLLSFVPLFYTRANFDKRILKLIVFSVILTIGSELIFTFYISVYGISNFAGHILKLIAFYLMYKAIIETGLQKPYSLLLTEVKNKQDKLELMNFELEERVEIRTRNLKMEVVERKIAEQKILWHKSTLQTVVDSISDPLILMDTSISIKTCNHAAFDYFNIRGKNFPDIIFNSLFKKYPDHPGIERIISSVIQSKQCIFRQKGFMDDKRLEKITIYPVENLEYQMKGAVVHISDETTEKLMEKQVNHRERLITLGFLMSGIAHEIKNPINFVTFNLPILHDYLEEIFNRLEPHIKKDPGKVFFGMSYSEFHEDIHKMLGNMEHGVKRINTLVTELRDFPSTNRTGMNNAVNIKDVLEKTLTICKGKVNKIIKTINISVPDNLPVISIDAGKLEQVLINLIINAAQACDKEDSWIEIQAFNGTGKDEKILVKIRDNGCGIDEDNIDHIFKPFFTTKPPGSGTGMGLYICDNIIQSLGGSLTLESRVKEGTSFTLTLPIQDGMQ